MVKAPFHWMCAIYGQLMRSGRMEDRWWCFPAAARADTRERGTRHRKMCILPVCQCEAGARFVVARPTFLIRTVS